MSEVYPSDIAITGIYEYLSADGHYIDYARIAKSEFLSRSVQFYEQERDVSSYSDLEKACFYANAYNVLGINAICQLNAKGQNYVGHTSGFRRFKFFFWKKRTVAGQRISLYALENKILRPLCIGQLNDPLLHVLINCCSISCPNLPPLFLTVQNWSEQGEVNARAYLSTQWGLEADAGPAYAISMIFKWFEADFECVGGVQSFVAKYCDDSCVTAKIEKMQYLDYDWAVNDKQFGVEESFKDEQEEPRAKSTRAKKKTTSSRSKKGKKSKKSGKK